MSICNETAENAKNLDKVIVIVLTVHMTVRCDSDNKWIIKFIDLLVEEEEDW